MPASITTVLLVLAVLLMAAGLPAVGILVGILALVFEVGLAAAS